MNSPIGCWRRNFTPPTCRRLSFCQSRCSASVSLPRSSLALAVFIPHPSLPPQGGKERFSSFIPCVSVCFRGHCFSPLTHRKRKSERRGQNVRSSFRVFPCDSVAERVSHLSVQRKRKGERRALPQRALDLDLPAVELDETARQGEAQASALLLACSVVADLAKFLEQRCLVFRANACACVLH